MELCYHRQRAEIPILLPLSYMSIIWVIIITVGSGREAQNFTSTYRMKLLRTASITFGDKTLNHHSDKKAGECRDALGSRTPGLPRPCQKPQQPEKQEVKTYAWKHCKCCKHLQLKALCCSHGTCSGRRYKPRWQPVSRGRRRLRWWRRTLPKRRSPLSRQAFPGACLHKWEPQNSLDATWKTSHRAAGEVQKMKTVIWMKMSTFALCHSWCALTPVNNWQLCVVLLRAAATCEVTSLWMPRWAWAHEHIF